MYAKNLSGNNMCMMCSQGSYIMRFLHAFHGNLRLQSVHSNKCKSNM